MLLFLDESGIDEKIAPCVVLGGISIPEENLWQFEQAVRSLQREVFGLELSQVGKEIKGTRLLKNKTFRLAAQGPPMEPERRRDLSLTFLQKGFEEKTQGHPVARSRDEYTAYGQASIAFIDRLLDVSALYGVKTFGAIVRKNAPRPADVSALRKDFNYLLERFFYYLETLPAHERGLVICDELEQSQSEVLINQISKYFQRTVRGQIRTNRIVPVPFFVHSHLTTATQLADVVCYVANWAVRIPGMEEPIRKELFHLGEKVLELQFRTQRIEEGETRSWPKYGFCYIEDLRPASERQG